MLLIANTLFCIQSALSFAINVSFRAVFIRFAVSLVIQVNFGVVATDSMLSLSIILESSKMNVSFVHSGQFSVFSFLIYSDRFVQFNWETRELNVTNWLSPPRPRRECHSIRLGKLVSHIRGGSTILPVLLGAWIWLKSTHNGFLSYRFNPPSCVFCRANEFAKIVHFAPVTSVHVIDISY